MQAAEALYRHYESIYNAWAAKPELGRPPVFIVVCNNTATSKLMADWISGYVREGGYEGDDAETLIRGTLGRLLFKGDDVKKSVKVISGGCCYK